MLLDKKTINRNEGDKQGETIDRQEREVNKNCYTTVQLPTADSANSLHETSQTHHAITGAKHPQGQRPSFERVTPRAIIVLDRWGHRRGLLLLARTAPSALECR